MSVIEPGERISPLASQMAAQTRDLAWTLAHFTFVANVTTLASECDIAHSPTMSVASCRNLPKQALAFIGESPGLLATYALFLAEPGSEVSLLVNEEQHHIVEQAFRVVQTQPLWQMVYRGSPTDLHIGRAIPLEDNDLTAIHALAKSEKTTLEMFSNNPLANGPAYGIWERRKLISLGMTNVCIPGAAQIANVMTRKDYRHQGCASEVVSALIKAHINQGRHVFLVVDQNNHNAVRLFRKIGFESENVMYWVKCVLKADQIKDKPR
jgi:ribosomal protein S18 acetylase RimI-like enzyme